MNEVDEWIEKLTQLLEEMDAKTVADAYSGKAAAKAAVQAWAVEMHAAALFLATYTGALQADAEAMIDAANTIIDTVQAILLALGIVYLLKKLRKKKDKKGTVIEIVVSEKEAKDSLGNRTSPIPSSDRKSKVEEAAFIALRIEWATHFLLTMMQALRLQDGLDGKELIWKAKLDKKTCKICAFMHNKKSIKGDFLPVILKQFPTYSAYVNWMGVPHAHPRCRCEAVIQ